MCSSYTAPVADSSGRQPPTDVARCRDLGSAREVREKGREGQCLYPKEGDRVVKVLIVWDENVSLLFMRAC